MTTITRAYAAQASDPRFPEHWSGPPELVDGIARRLGTSREDRVIDVAAGVGGPARRLAEITACEVVGVDLVSELLVRARDAARTLGRGAVTVVAGNAEALPLASGAGDQLWCLGAVAHLGDLDAFAREAARVLRPAGAIAVTEAFAEGSTPPRFASSAPRPWRAIAVEEVTEALERQGFRDVARHPWPARAEASPPSDPLLAADLREGRLRPALVTARRA